MQRNFSVCKVSLLPVAAGEVDKRRKCGEFTVTRSLREKVCQRCDLGEKSFKCAIRVCQQRRPPLSNFMKEILSEFRRKSRVVV